MACIVCISGVAKLKEEVEEGFSVKGTFTTGIRYFCIYVWYLTYCSLVTGQLDSGGRWCCDLKKS